MSEPDQEGREHTALVTGASSGIGRSIASLLAGRGYDLVIVARRTERLEALKGELESRHQVHVRPLVSDLADPASPAIITSALDADGIVVDFLVNNAGYSLAGNYADTTWEDQQRFVRVMALSPLELTHRLLPPMVAAGWGRIVNVCSVAALAAATPQTVLYSSTKAMMLNFTEGLALETRGTGVKCTASLPGFTATEIFAVSGWGELESHRLLRPLFMSPETVACEAYEAVMAGKTRVVHGWHHRLMGSIFVHAPTPLRRKLALITAAMQLTD
jgi:short-subunit dehydrogenase